MAEHHSEVLYMKIFYYLLALTILEILVALPTYATWVKAILLIAMALGKAAPGGNVFYAPALRAPHSWSDCLHSFSHLRVPGVHVDP